MIKLEDVQVGFVGLIAETSITRFRDSPKKVAQSWTSCTDRRCWWRLFGVRGKRRNVRQRQREVKGRLNTVTQTWECWYSTVRRNYGSTHNPNMLVHFQKKEKKFTKRISISQNLLVVYHIIYIFFCFSNIIAEFRQEGAFSTGVRWQEGMCLDEQGSRYTAQDTDVKVVVSYRSPYYSSEEQRHNKSCCKK